MFKTISLMKKQSSKLFPDIQSIRNSSVEQNNARKNNSLDSKNNNLKINSSENKIIKLDFLQNI